MTPLRPMQTRHLVAAIARRTWTLRPLHTTAPSSRGDIMAKYRRPANMPANILVHLPHMPAVSDAAQVASTPTPPTRREAVVEVEGVKVPPKPITPGDEDCCMSGCVHCVLTIYAEDLEEYTEAVKEARTRLEKKGVPHAEWPEAVTEGEKQDGGEGDEPAALPAMDPTMAAFMALEKKLKSH